MLFVFALLAVAQASNVVSLTSSNFDSFVGGPKGAFVKFYAPWCGHCKALAPDYEKVADMFGKSPKVTVAEVNCDEDKPLCGRFSVNGYPTLKFFPSQSIKPTDYKGSRTADEIATFIEQNSGARRVGPRTDVLALNEANFDKIVMDSSKDALVKFYAPWCGHCKALAPVYEKLATAFKNEDNVVVAEVNCDVESKLCSRFSVSGFPTLKFFPKANKEGESYEGGRELDDLLQHLNSNLNLDRLASGMLGGQAGKIAQLDQLAAKYLAAQDKPALLTHAQTIVASLSGPAAKNGKFYVKFMELISNKGAEFVQTEKARLQRVIDGGNVSGKKLDDFTIRLNILNSF
jgi:protein disulfide-isomerase A6